MFLSLYFLNNWKHLAPSSIHNYNILFLIIVKDEGSNYFKLAKTNSASTLEGIIFDKIQGIVFQLLLILVIMVVLLPPVSQGLNINEPRNAVIV